MTNYQSTSVAAQILPKDWDLIPLGDLGEFLRGANISKSDVVEHGLPCILYGEIYTRHDSYIRKFHSFIDQETALASTKIVEGDLLFAGSGETPEEIGKCVAYINNEEAYAGGDIIILRPTRGHSLFLGFALNSYVVNKQKYQFAQGHSVVHIYSDQLKKVKVPFPPLPEQRKIAEILGTWDEAIRLTAELIAAKQQRKKGLMQRLLTGEVRFPGFAGRQFKEVKLGDVFTERSDKGNDHLPLLSITRERGIVLRDEIDRRDTSNSDKSSYLLIREGDIGYNTMRMWQGVSAVSSLEGIVSPAYTVCVPNISKIVPSFMGYLFKLPSIINLFWRYSQGLVNDTLSLKYHNFAKIIVKLPSLDEQKKISKVLELCDEEINLLEQKHAALQQQKKGLMQRLLTGQVRVRG